MRHLALILVTSSFFTACMTEADRALWTETKDTLKTGEFGSVDSAHSPKVAKAPEATPSKGKARSSQATTGR